MTLTRFSGWIGLIVGAWIASTMLVSQPIVRAPAAAPAPAETQVADQSIRRRAPVVIHPQLIVPVQGVTVGQLIDTWGATRAEGRLHEGIDILAPLGTPVRAVAEGRIVKFFDSVRGGATIYQFDASERFVYYYAHLNRRASGLAEGDIVEQGDIIGYVGMSGNAPVPHLHFEIQRLTPERHWWQADSINPYPFLLAGRAPS
jgi:murein DD-endopeptidase MepM/ murein hydrolase activator NlpD